MKKGIHPEYKEVTVVLNDGTEFVTRSTMDLKDGVYRPEVDSSNHPLYTNKQKMIMNDGRVEKFNRRYGKKKKK